jgi:hypothetical protein
MSWSRSASSSPDAEIERGPAVTLAQAARLIARSRARPLRIVGWAALCAVLVVTGTALVERRFSPRFVLSATEAERDAEIIPPPKRALREYVLGAVFTSSRLLQIAQEQGLYANLVADDPHAAVESFREDIRVEVYRNWFVEERSSKDVPRSARIAITYLSADRRLAMRVTERLGELVVEHELERRRAHADRVARDAEGDLRSARERLLKEKRRWVEKSFAVARDHRAASRIDLASSTRDLERLEQELELAERRKAALELGGALEHADLGLRFEVVERGDIPISAELEAGELALLGALVFLLGLPLSALGVGAFDGAIHDVRDLTESGFTVLGRVPAPSRTRMRS